MVFTEDKLGLTLKSHEHIDPLGHRIPETIVKSTIFSVGQVSHPIRVRVDLRCCFSLFSLERMDTKSLFVCIFAGRGRAAVSERREYYKLAVSRCPAYFKDCATPDSPAVSHEIGSASSVRR